MLTLEQALLMLGDQLPGMLLAAIICGLFFFVLYKRINRDHFHEINRIHRDVPVVHAADFLVGHDVYVVISNNAMEQHADACWLTGTLQYVVDKSKDYGRLVFIDPRQYICINSISTAVADGLAPLPTTNLVKSRETFYRQFMRAVRAIAYMEGLEDVLPNLHTKFNAADYARMKPADLFDWLWNCLSSTATSARPEKALRQLYDMTKQLYVTGHYASASQPVLPTFGFSSTSASYLDYPLPGLSVRLYNTTHKSLSTIRAMYALDSKKIQDVSIPYNAIDEYDSNRVLKSLLPVANALIAAQTKLPTLFHDNGLPVFVTYLKDKLTTKIFFLYNENAEACIASSFQTFAFTPRSPLTFDDVVVYPAPPPVYEASPAYEHAPVIDITQEPPNTAHRPSAAAAAAAVAEFRSRTAPVESPKEPKSALKSSDRSQPSMRPAGRLGWRASNQTIVFSILCLMLLPAALAETCEPCRPCVEWSPKNRFDNDWDHPISGARFNCWLQAILDFDRIYIVCWIIYAAFGPSRRDTYIFRMSSLFVICKTLGFCNGSAMLAAAFMSFLVYLAECYQSIFFYIGLTARFINQLLRGRSPSIAARNAMADSTFPFLQEAVLNEGSRLSVEHDGRSHYTYNFYTAAYVATVTFGFLPTAQAAEASSGSVPSAPITELLWVLVFMWLAVIVYNRFHARPVARPREYMRVEVPHEEPGLLRHPATWAALAASCFPVAQAASSAGCTASSPWLWLLLPLVAVYSVMLTLVCLYCWTRTIDALPEDALPEEIEVATARAIPNDYNLEPAEEPPAYVETESPPPYVASNHRRNRHVRFSSTATAIALIIFLLPLASAFGVDSNCTTIQTRIPSPSSAAWVLLFALYFLTAAFAATAFWAYIRMHPPCPNPALHDPDLEQDNYALEPEPIDFGAPFAIPTRNVTRTRSRAPILCLLLLAFVCTLPTADASPTWVQQHPDEHHYFIRYTAFGTSVVSVCHWFNAIFMLAFVAYGIFILNLRDLSLWPIYFILSIIAFLCIFIHPVLMVCVNFCIVAIACGSYSLIIGSALALCLLVGSSFIVMDDPASRLPCNSALSATLAQPHLFSAYEHCFPGKRMIGMHDTTSRYIFSHENGKESMTIVTAPSDRILDQPRWQYNIVQITCALACVMTPTEAYMSVYPNGFYAIGSRDRNVALLPEVIFPAEGKYYIVGDPTNLREEIDGFEIKSLRNPAKDKCIVGSKKVNGVCKDDKAYTVIRANGFNATSCMRSETVSDCLQRLLKERETQERLDAAQAKERLENVAPAYQYANPHDMGKGEPVVIAEAPKLDMYEHLFIAPRPNCDYPLMDVHKYTSAWMVDDTADAYRSEVARVARDFKILRAEAVTVRDRCKAANVPFFMGYLSFSEKLLTDTNTKIARHASSQAKHDDPVDGSFFFALDYEPFSDVSDTCVVPASDIELISNELSKYIENPIWQFSQTLIVNFSAHPTVIANANRMCDDELSLLAYIVSRTPAAASSIFSAEVPQMEKNLPSVAIDEPLRQIWKHCDMTPEIASVIHSVVVQDEDGVFRYATGHELYKHGPAFGIPYEPTDACDLRYKYTDTGLLGVNILNVKYVASTELRYFNAAGDLFTMTQPSEPMFTLASFDGRTYCPAPATDCGDADRVMQPYLFFGVVKTIHVSAGYERVLNLIESWLFSLPEFKADKYAILRHALLNYDAFCGPSGCRISYKELPQVPAAFRHHFEIDDSIEAIPDWRTDISSPAVRDLKETLRRECGENFEIFTVDDVPTLIYDSNALYHGYSPDAVMGRCKSRPDRFYRAKTLYSWYAGTLPFWIGSCSIERMEGTCVFINAGEPSKYRLTDQQFRTSGTIFGTDSGYIYMGNTLADALNVFFDEWREAALTYICSILVSAALCTVFPNAAILGFAYLLTARYAAGATIAAGLIKMHDVDPLMSVCLNLGFALAFYSARPGTLHSIFFYISMARVEYFLLSPLLNQFFLSLIVITAALRFILSRSRVWERSVEINAKNADRLFALLEGIDTDDANYRTMLDTVTAVRNQVYTSAVHTPQISYGSSIGNLFDDLALVCTHPVKAMKATLEAGSKPAHLTFKVVKFQLEKEMMASVFKDRIIIQTHAMLNPTKQAFSAIDWAKHFGAFGSNFHLATYHPSLIHLTYTPNSQYAAELDDFKFKRMAKYTETSAYLYTINAAPVKILANWTGTTTAANFSGLCGAPIVASFGKESAVIGFHCGNVSTMSGHQIPIMCDDGGLFSGHSINDIVQPGFLAKHKVQVHLIGIAQAVQSVVAAHYTRAQSREYHAKTSTLSARCKSILQITDEDLSEYIAQLDTVRPITRPLVAPRQLLALVCSYLNTHIVDRKDLWAIPPHHDSCVEALDVMLESVFDNLGPIATTAASLESWAPPQVERPLALLTTFTSYFAKLYFDFGDWQYVYWTAGACSIFGLIMMFLRAYRHMWETRLSRAMLEAGPVILPNFRGHQAKDSDFFNWNKADDVTLNTYKTSAQAFMRAIGKVVAVLDPTALKLADILEEIKNAETVEDVKYITLINSLHISSIIRAHYPDLLPSNAVVALESVDTATTAIREWMRTVPRLQEDMPILEKLLSEDLAGAIEQVRDICMSNQDFKILANLAMIVEAETADMAKSERVSMNNLMSELRRRAKTALKEQNIALAQAALQRSREIKEQRRNAMAANVDQAAAARANARSAAFKSALMKLVEHALMLTHDNIDTVLGDPTAYRNKLAEILAKFKPTIASESARFIVEIAEPETLKDHEDKVEEIAAYLEANRSQLFQCTFCNTKMPESQFVSHAIMSGSCSPALVTHHPCGKKYNPHADKRSVITRCDGCRVCSTCNGNPRPINWRLAGSCTNGGHHGLPCPHRLRCQDPSCNYDHFFIQDTAPATSAELEADLNGAAAAAPDVNQTYQLQAFSQSPTTKMTAVGIHVLHKNVKVGSLEPFDDSINCGGFYVSHEHLASQNSIIHLLKNIPQTR